MRTVQTNYTAIPYPSRETTILPNGLQTKVEWDYWSFDLVKEKREFGWGQGTPGALVRRTDYGSGYCDRKPPSEIIYDGNSNQLASTTYEFDNYTAGLGASGAVNLTAPAAARCNVTAIQRWRNTDGATLTTRMQYDDAGNVLSATDPLTHTTTTSYADVWGNATCTPASGHAAAYPTQVTDPAGLTTKHSYNSCTGTVATATDPNNQATTLSYDLMDRVIQTTLPDTGRTSTCFSEVSGGSCYSNSYPLKIVATQKITTSMNKISTIVLDGLARVSQTQLNSDPDGVTYVDTTYDGAEHKSTVSNPYRAVSDPTYGITTYQYDALDRVTKLIPPDGSSSANNVSSTYDIASGTVNCTTVTDQAGKSRKSCADALGRLTQVFEDPSGKNYETDYQYDVLNNLLRVDQRGTAPVDSTYWRTRTFAYNSLSQLLCAANPEIAPLGTTCPNPDNGSYTAGTVRYAYDNGGNLITKTSPKPNQASSSVTVQVTFTYDNDNRLVQKSYNDGSTPTVKFAYDGASLTGCTVAPPTLTDSYPNGHRTSMCDASGSTAWSHEVLGRVVTKKEKIDTFNQSVTYAYNLDGSVNTETYPTSHVLSYGPGGAGRPLSLTDTTGSINYVSACLTAPCYAPHGALQQARFGVTGTFAGITVQNNYNNRLQPTLISATTPTPSTVLSLTYDFHLGSGDNGNVFQIANGRDSNRTQNFLYDSLNRIQQAYTNGTNWGETFSPNATAPGVPPTTSGIDAWGNLTNRSSVTNRTNYEPLNASANKQNRLIGFGYDAAGNMTSNGTASYAYDAENHLISTAGYSYSYDGDGNRVKKTNGSTGTIYWLDAGGAVINEANLAGTTQTEYVFFGGKRIARRDVPTGQKHYYFSDHLGSASVVTNATGTIQNESDYYPYGGEIAVTNNDPNTYKFTGKERDSESGLDNFEARFDASSLGRFMSVDAKMVTIKRFGDPQQWNRFAYTANRPTKYVDPDGMELRLAPGQSATDANEVAVVLARQYQKANTRAFIKAIVTSPVKNTIGKVAIPDNNPPVITYGQNLTYVPGKNGIPDTSDLSKVTNDIQLDIDKANRKGRDINKFAKHELYHGNEINTDLDQAIKDNKTGVDETNATAFEDSKDDPDSMSFEDALTEIQGILGISKKDNRKQPTQCDKNHVMTFDPFDGEPE